MWLCHFSITIQLRITMHVPPDLDPHFHSLVALINLHQFFMLGSLSPLPYNVGSSYILYLIHIFIMVFTCQSGICHLTLTSFSLSTDFIKFTSSFHYGVTFSTPYNLGSPSPRFLCRPTTLYIIARAVERQSAIYTENSWFASPALGRHISTFRGYRILFSIRNPYINRFTNHFSIHS